MSPRPDLLVDETVPREPRQGRSRAARRRLGEAALALFSEKGFEATSVQDIARRAKRPVGTFYQHFATKRQLLLVLMDELIAGLSRLQFEPQPGVESRAALRGLLSGAFAHDLRYLGAYRAWREAILSDPSLAEKQRAIQTWTQGRVESVLERLLKLPRARRRVDVKGLARVMDTLFWNLLAEATYGGGPPEESIEAVTTLLHHSLFSDA